MSMTMPCSVHALLSFTAHASLICDAQIVINIPCQPAELERSSDCEKHHDEINEGGRVAGVRSIDRGTALHAGASTGFSSRSD